MFLPWEHQIFIIISKLHTYDLIQLYVFYDVFEQQYEKLYLQVIFIELSPARLIRVVH